MSYSTRSAADKTVTDLYGETNAKISAAYLLPHIKPTSHILDVGCGPGTITADFAQIAKSGKTIGIDYSAGVIERASKSFPPSTHPNLSFTVGNALKLEFPDNTFDIVHVHQVLMHLPLPGPVTALKEFLRVLKPGGLVAVRESSVSKILSLKPDIPAIRGYWASIVLFMQKWGGHADASDRLEEWAKAAGLKKVEVTKSSLNNPSHSARMKGSQADKMMALGTCTKEELESWRKGWEEWETTDGSELVLDTRELLGWKDI